MSFAYTAARRLIFTPDAHTMITSAMCGVLLSFPAFRLRHATSYFLARYYAASNMLLLSSADVTWPMLAPHDRLYDESTHYVKPYAICVSASAMLSQMRYTPPLYDGATITPYCLSSCREAYGHFMPPCSSPSENGDTRGLPPVTPLVMPPLAFRSSRPRHALATFQGCHRFRMFDQPQ